MANVIIQDAKKTGRHRVCCQEVRNRHQQPGNERSCRSNWRSEAVKQWRWEEHRGGIIDEDYTFTGRRKEFHSIRGIWKNRSTLTMES